MTYTFSDELISDLHKEARRHRPPLAWADKWVDCSSDQKQIIWNDLLNEIELSKKALSFTEKKSAQEFEASILETISLGASDRQTAILWIIQGMYLSKHDLKFGGEFICFDQQLNYSYAAEFDPICKMLLDKVKSV